MKTAIRLMTDRLVLQALAPDRAVDVADYVARNREHFGRWDPRRPPTYFEAAHWREELEASERAAAEGRRYRLHVSSASDPTRIIAHVNFSDVVRGAFQACHLGYGVDHEREGQGLMREALEAAIAWLFEAKNLHRIEANYRPENSRSGKLLERLGFAPQGFARRYLLIDGEWRDHVLTALTNPRWRAVDL